MNQEERNQIIWTVVATIPAGNVATYGQVAELSGLARGARQVGYALKHLGADTKIPWHRVINSQGKISFPEGSEPYLKQKQRLQDEGVLVRGNRISLKQFRWQA